MNEERKKILLVEDDEFLSELYATKLGMENFQVISAFDGLKALRLAKEKMPDLILLDIILPKMNGIDVLKNLKKESKTKNIPVILLTNLSQKNEVDEGLRAGASDYLIKAHFMPSEVVMKIKNFFSNRI